MTKETEPRFQNEDGEKLILPGGATRSEKAPPFHLVPGDGLRRTALRFGLGAEKHGINNWKLCLETEENARAFADEAYNHMIVHTVKMNSGNFPDDDHLGAIGWCVFVLSYIEAKYCKPWTDLQRTA
jgi:hypothetical protein